MQVGQPTGDLRCIEDGPLFWKARVAHVVYVELEVPTVHNGQHQTQRFLRLKCIRQADLQRQEQGSYELQLNATITSRQQGLTSRTARDRCI